MLEIKQNTSRNILYSVLYDRFDTNQFQYMNITTHNRFRIKRRLYDTLVKLFYFLCVMTKMMMMMMNDSSKWPPEKLNSCC